MSTQTTTAADPIVKKITIDGVTLPINGERNLLEVIRKAGIDLPTFCYHSDLSVYGACRLCLVDVQGRGIMGACSTPPESGMVVRTQTDELREIRRIAVELLLANHDQSCPTCPKSADCQLQDLARRLGIRQVRFKPVHQSRPVDDSSPSLVRDPNKCVLCGDCVRFCREIQGIGAIGFAYRGSDAQVVPAFGRLMGEVECVNCGQCAAVCPTGALAPRSEVDDVWRALHDSSKLVVAQVAPAVRVALGECFGEPPGTITTPKIVAALRRLGFDLVYDTSFAADLTVLEEANEFIARKTQGQRLPQFTSCCPAWVKFAEQYYPSLLDNLSSCRSPQQMLGSLIKHVLPEQRGIRPADVVVVSIMPCTAKKFEARRPELSRDGVRDVDFVLTTQEVARMIQEAGFDWQTLGPANGAAQAPSPASASADRTPDGFDLPLGFGTGAGVIFGASGGVSEAVLRYAGEKLTGRPLDHVDIEDVRGDAPLRTRTLRIGGHTLKLGIVHGLSRAREVANAIMRGECDLDLIEVMACPGGCVGGAGQPIARHSDDRRHRAAGLYWADRMLPARTSQDNVPLADCYRQHLGEVGGHRAHDLLHTHYEPRRRLDGETLGFDRSNGTPTVRVVVCAGTNCFVKGSQKILQRLLDYVDERGLHDRVEVAASFCFEACDEGPTVTINGQPIHRCQASAALAEIERLLSTDNPTEDSK